MSVSQERPVIPIIMAGGQGKRMNSDLPKVLHPIHGEPMLVRILKTVRGLNPLKIYVVVGTHRDTITDAVRVHLGDAPDIEYVDQPDARGTGHAIQCCLPQIATHEDTNVLILSGDTPLLSTELLHMVTNHATIHPTSVITTMKLINPTGYGRIVDRGGKFMGIVEEKDCMAVEREIRVVNCGLYRVPSESLLTYLPQLTDDNAQNEFYLTDIFKLMHQSEPGLIETLMVPNNMQYQLHGVKTSEQLVQLENIEQIKIR